MWFNNNESTSIDLVVFLSGKPDILSGFFHYYTSENEPDIFKMSFLD